MPVVPSDAGVPAVMMLAGSDLPAPPPPIPAEGKSVTPWRAAADGGVAIGRASERAAIATAGFFNRYARRVAAGF
jgi:hypothetical protein